ncbi:hypothetical protein [Bacillus sp. Marseille-P3800]|uniref:hypothetical protein n=1 Tax=Bacillus sp. Marseille-P3800 TaxID=2014782 RepID=UPI000C0856E2|nr:hypothetical protein [Bacillus sp. Marseille-P3800]
MFRKIMFFAFIFLIAISPATASASSSASVDLDGVLDGYTEEQIEKSLQEVEYIFTEILTFDEEMGYTVNENELAKSPYSELQKDGMVAFADYMNAELNNEVTVQNTVVRCIEDAVGIANGALNEMQEAIEAGNWLTVLGYLGAMGVAVHPATLFGFFLLCGAPAASEVPKEEI